MKRNYIGQSWVDDIIKDGDPHAIHPATALKLIAHDLDREYKEFGAVGHLELWQHDDLGTKGLFIGDTSSLPDAGWEFVTTLF